MLPVVLDKVLERLAPRRDVPARPVRPEPGGWAEARTSLASTLSIGCPGLPI